MTTEEKFRAAVNVIRNLPKNGTYQPSHELMLRFYGFYKQATEGPCFAPKPAFWEVVKKMKWDAWNKLGNMPSEEAMNNYVEELKKIVETMSYTDNVAHFLGSLGSFYDAVPQEDLELLIGNVIDRVRSQPDSPLHNTPLVSREASPNRVMNSSTNGHITSSLETSPASSYSASPQPPDPDDEEEEEEFIDTVEAVPERVTVSKKSHLSNGVPAMNNSNQTEIIPNGHMNGAATIINGQHSHYTQDEKHSSGGTVTDRGRTRERGVPRVPREGMNCIAEQNSDVEAFRDITEQIQATMRELTRDLKRVNDQVKVLEQSVLHNSVSRIGEGRKSQWPFPELSRRTVMFVVLWPIFVHAVIWWLRNRRNVRSRLV